MDMPRLFPIGEVAKLFNLSVSSLRHYDNTGLLSPKYTDPETGYRYYGPRQFEALNTIRYLRAGYAAPRYRGFSEEPRRRYNRREALPPETGGQPTNIGICTASRIDRQLKN